MDEVIIDTSAWIESFRPRGDAVLGHAVRELIVSGRVLLPGIIRAEILRGTRDRKEYNRLNGLLDGLSYLSVPDDFWKRLAEFSYSLFRSGQTVPLANAYIALLCIENKASLLHRDKHFDRIAEKSSLRIFASYPRGK